ncbi:DUF4145 domain-containing protein [Massilia sp. Mn16-1_5]|uniref:DUF4145 domain-containing protein n=1 Tax=Massilia sp. Mn16-1_5 TaxID=2079199 RepID=UPI001E58B37B|nr:DUF4145 domain-containing protein [Massilia sp. Mn16-1_5]
MNEVFARRFHELSVKQSKITFAEDSMGGGYVPAGKWQGWATSAQSLLRAVFGDSGQHYINFTATYNDCKGYAYEILAMFDILNSAKEDFEGGYVFNVDLRVSGEVFGDFVGLARTALNEGHKDVAAVLACAALEDALKRYAAAKGLGVEEKAMADVINALKGAGLVAGAQKAMLDRMPTIRNYALHANWEKISEPDVGSVIGFVEQFLLTKFSA